MHSGNFPSEKRNPTSVILFKPKQTDESARATAQAIKLINWIRKSNVVRFDQFVAKVRNEKLIKDDYAVSLHSSVVYKQVHGKDKSDEKEANKNSMVKRVGEILKEGNQGKPITVSFNSLPG